jgi:RHS repeat-associated protein
MGKSARTREERSMRHGAGLCWIGLAGLLALPGSAGGQGSCVTLSGGCSPPVHPSQCFPDAAGPISWQDLAGFRTRQVRTLPDSPLSACHPPVGIGTRPVCCSPLHPPASSGPSVHLRIEGQRVWVDYDAPNYDCQNTGDWPPAYTCTNDPFVSSDHLLLFRGSDLLSSAFIYYENGSWDTGIDLPCGTDALTARIEYLAAPAQVIGASDTETVKTHCADRRTCPAGGGGGAPASGAGKPINVGSGDVSLSLPFFTLAQEPLSLSFGLSYHSAPPLYPGLVSSSVGLGWTHPFAQTLRPTDPSGFTLYHLTAEGFESKYTQTSPGTWMASSPGELRGTVTLAGGRYILNDLDGTATAFEAASGRWLSTTDRWGNQLSGAYDRAGNLASVTDSEGRQVILIYSGSALVQITLPDGQVWRLFYDGPRLAAIFDPIHSGTTPWRSFAYTSDSQGVERLLTEMRDEAGVLLEGHAYDGDDRGTTSVSEGGRDRVTIEYDTPVPGEQRVTHAIDGTISQVSDFTLIYNKGRYLPVRILGNCATCAGATSDDQSFTYMPDNHVLSRTDALGHLTRWTYNGDGNVISMTEAAGTPEERTTTYAYGYPAWPNFRTQVVEPSVVKPFSVKVTSLTWNSTGAPETTLTTSETGFLTPSDGSPTTYTTVSTFDALHRHLATDGPRTDVADVVTMAYYDDADPIADRRGRLARTTDATGLTTTFDDYDAFGAARTVTDPNGVVTRRETDGRGRVVSSTSKAVAGDPAEAADDVSTFRYDGRDRLMETILPRGNATGYGYEDGTDRMTDTIRLDVAGNQIERRHLTLNAIGGKVREEDQLCAAPGSACSSWATKRSESFAYDPHNRLSAILHPVPAGSGVFYAYDPDGLLSAIQDENHPSPNTRQTYDSLHRLTQITQTLTSAPGGAAVTSYGYDERDNLSSVTDPNRNTTRYQFDDFHRLARQESPVTGTTLYLYDPAGNLLATSDARGAVTQRTYDPSNRLLTATAQLAGAPTETVTYSYDASGPGNYGKGRLAKMTDPSGSTSYTYERRGLLKSSAQTILGTTYTTSFQHDPNGNRTAITYPSGRQVTSSFDFADRPFSVTSPGAIYVTSTSYLPFGPEAQTAFGNGTVRTATFDQRYRPVENRLDGSAGPLADYLYSEDPLGNITGLHDALDSGYDRDFSYDDLYRLTRASTGSALWGSGSYRYDPMGNMTSLALGTARALDFSYEGSLPKLAAVTPPGGPGRTVTYDPAGNELTVGVASYVYSARNLLASADGLAYTYDGRGVRAALSVATALGSASGTVIDGVTGLPLAGAMVRLSGTSDATATDAAGHFTLIRTAGSYTATASKAGYLPATSFPFLLPAGGDVMVSVISLFPAPGTITGTVLSSLSGQPLGGVRITAAETGDEAVTGVDGTFSFSLPAGTYTLTLAYPGYQSQTLPTLPLAAGATSSVGTVTLVALPGALTGKVVSSASSAPIAGATVTAVPVATGPLATSSLIATTDAAGSFSLAVSAGSYIVTITQTGFGSRTLATPLVGPGFTFSLGTVPLDALGTITGHVVRAADGSPVAGATVGVSGTLNQTTTDAAGAFTLTQPAGIVTLTVTAQGLAGFTTGPLTVPPGGTLDAGTLPLAAVALAVSVGYADDLRKTTTFPVPWQGSPNVVFLGGGETFDAGAIRLDNGTGQEIDVDSVSVDLGRPGPVFNLWGSFTIPAHGSVILTQTKQYDFDTSDFPILHCGETLLPGEPRVPKVTVTIGGAATTYFDTTHILDTGGIDLAACGPDSPNESLPWRLIGTAGVGSSGDFLLAPAVGTPSVLGSSFSLTATVTDPNQQPVPGVTVVFEATSGPNRGLTGQAVTDAAGKARFTYTGSIAGTDLWQAKIPNPSGGAAVSNPAAVVWPSIPGIGIAVGYADSLRPNVSFPNPWDPSPTLVFVGGGIIFDAGAVRIDNETDQPRHVDRVVIDLGRPGPVFDFSQWGNFTIPAHGSAIVTQLSSFNFDSSDFPIVECGGTVPPTDKRTPKVTITMEGLTASYLDTGHILDTLGQDIASCGPNEPNESLQWRPIGGESTTSPGQVALRPAVSTFPVGGAATLEAIATDAGGETIPGALVRFTILSGPNANRIVESRTDASGIARFTYTSASPGTDTVKATLFNTTFTALFSNTVAVTWLPAVHLALSPASASQPIGTPYNTTLQVTDNGGQPVSNLTVTFRVTSGPDAGRTGRGTTGTDGKTLFTYTTKDAGTDILEADLLLQNGGTLASNRVTMTWTSPLSLTLAPFTSTYQLGNTATVTATLTDGSGQPVGGAALVFQVPSGPDAGRSAQAVTNATGQATFSLAGTQQGADTVQATAQRGGAVSNLVTVTWTATATTLLYTGASFGEYSDAMVLSARLLETATGRPVPGQPVAFSLGGQTGTAITGADGTATLTLTPTMAPGAVSLTLSFAGGGGFASSSASLLLPIVRDETVLTYTGKSALATGQAQTVTARLTDGEDGTPIPGKTVTFTFGSTTASATTRADGTATAMLTFSATQPTGPAALAIAFVGDAYLRPARATAPVLLYQPASFVVWGGNSPGLALGQRVNFWGSQWEKQVTGGDYAANSSFKGFTSPMTVPLAPCEPTAHTTGTPLLDANCWTSKPGNSMPPATVAAYIEAIVSTSVAKSDSTLYGNIAATVVLQVDPSSPYGPDPGHPGFGAIVAVIDDGAGLFAKAARPASLSAASTGAQALVGKLQSAALSAIAAGARQFFLYTPEMNLLAETELTTSAHPLVANEYIWWNGHPVAQVDATGTTSWTLTDHLGTPILQTSAQQGIVWRAEYEPFGTVYALRSYDRHQPLRLPGQEAEQLGLGANGVTDRSYNVHRWYQPELGRYIDPDPIGLSGDLNLYSYALVNPIRLSDSIGLSPRPLPPSRQQPRPCKPHEQEECRSYCAIQGKTMESCMVSRVFRLVRSKNGFEIWRWVDGPLSCSCNDPDEEPFIKRCVRNLEKGISGIIQWLADHPPHPPVLPGPIPVPLPVPVG